MDRFEGIPGYKVVVKLDYVGSKEIIHHLATFTDKWYVFDEFIYRQVDRDEAATIKHDWAVDYGNTYPRYSVTFYYETASIISATEFIQAASDRRGKLHFAHIEPTMIFPHFGIRK